MKISFDNVSPNDAETLIRTQQRAHDPLARLFVSDEDLLKLKDEVLMLRSENQRLRAIERRFEAYSRERQREALSGRTGPVISGLFIWDESSGEFVNARPSDLP